MLIKRRTSEILWPLCKPKAASEKAQSVKGMSGGTVTTGDFSERFLEFSYCWIKASLSLTHTHTYMHARTHRH